MHYVRLKPTHRVTLEEVDIIKNMELSTPEERFRSPTTGETFEVYFEGTEAECREFIQNIKLIQLRDQFEIFEHKIMTA